ncbi:MAG: TolC family protein [Deltaproteobacteria bacterium]|nr:TolC family protein [Deltaproteobacteria bacterium]
MFKNALLFFTAISVLAASGCVDSANDATWLDAPPLGQEFSSFRSPEKPPATVSETYEIAEPNGVITLRQALALALMRNPELRAFSWETRASEARKLQASLRPNPELEVEVEEVGGSGQWRGFDGAETTIQLGQLIELNGKLRKRTRLASLEKELAELDYQAKRLDVLTDTTKLFVSVLAAQEQLTLTEELVQLSEQVLTTVSQRVEAGKDSPVEKTKSEIALASVRIERERARQNLESARKQLSAVWATNSPAFERVAGQLDVVTPIPTEDQVLDLIGQNPDISRWSVELEQRRAALELEKAKATPDVTVSVGYKRLNGEDQDLAVFGLSIPLPVANRNQGGILEAIHRVAKAGEERTAVESRVGSALAKAYQSLSNAYTEATNLKNKVLDGAQDVFNASTEAYREGKLDYLNVLDAQRTLFEARGRYIEALAAYHTARAEVERLIGQRIDAIETTQKQQ